MPNFFDPDNGPDYEDYIRDESEGEYQARQLYKERKYRGGRRGGKSAYAEELLAQLFRSDPDSRVLLASNKGNRLVDGNQEVDCTVTKLYRETERAALMDLSFSLEPDEVHEPKGWWLPKSQFMASGNCVRIKRWILEKRLQEGQTATALVENLLANQPVKG